MTQDFITPITGATHLVEGEAKGRFPACNGFLFTGDPVVLLDAGMGLDRLKELDSRFHVDVLIISHSHPDHIRGAHFFRDRTLLLPEETPESAYELETLGRRFMDNEPAALRWAQLVKDFYGVQSLWPPQGRFSNDEILDFGSKRLRAIHAPGHIHDHYCFREETHGVLFSTDVDLTPFGPWYGNPESSAEVFRESVKKVAGLEAEWVCSSHRPPIRGDAADAFAEYLQCFDRHAQMILEMCREPATLEDMTARSPFYRNSLPDRMVQDVFERIMIRNNLEILERRGLIRSAHGLYMQVEATQGS
jgi:glyoxylase-like metal-dependent hydrolase (beta-lactamase superfamily II)